MESYLSGGLYYMQKKAVPYGTGLILSYFVRNYHRCLIYSNNIHIDLVMSSLTIDAKLF